MGVCLAIVGTLAIAGCTSTPLGLMGPVAVPEGDATAADVELLVATTREQDPDPNFLFSGERARDLSYAEIGVSVPPTHVTGELELPPRIPGDPAKEFVTTGVEPLDAAGFRSVLHQQLRDNGNRHVLVFVHGYNNTFGAAVFRLAQIDYDTGAPVVPVLFTWPSRGHLLAYPYDRESANFSRTSLERLLQDLADDPNVGEVSILAHSMGNWVTLEALRQQAIRQGRISPKITEVMLAAPDVDVHVARTQFDDMGHERPHFTLFVSQDDKALRFSRRFWRSADRLGSIDPNVEPYRSALEHYNITVIDLTQLKAGDRMHHAKFAEQPDVVRFIGARLAEGQDIHTLNIGLGDHMQHLLTSVTGG
jgi:esterase/lipase superfamily enzyme